MPPQSNLRSAEFMSYDFTAGRFQKNGLWNKFTTRSSHTKGKNMNAGMMTLRCTAPQMGLVALLSILGAVSAFGATNTVSCTSSITFSPSSVTINVNDTIHWSWAGSAHSTTSTNVPALWDSGIHNQPFDFFFTFTSPGTYGYHCSNPSHSAMKGQVIVNGVANNPPSVTITNPANGTVFNAPAAFTLGATATDSDGSVTNVQFTQGTTILTNKTTAPYGVGVTNLAAGSYSFSAIASDNSGAKTTNTISVTVNALPSVTITNPPSGATFAAPWSGPIGATASDTDGSVARVQFFSDGASLGIASNAPYSLSSGVPAGSHTLTAVAMDNRGATNTSAPVAISVVTPVPIILGGMARLSSTQFQFSYSANPGLRYVVERSPNLTGFVPLATNVAASTNVVVTDGAATNPINFYRVGRLPNP
jgi:plastocyanin